MRFDDRSLHPDLFGQSGPMTTAIQLVGMLAALALAVGTVTMIVGLVTARDGRETANGFE